jgi:bla regulator protein BlaR1
MVNEFPELLLRLTMASSVALGLVLLLRLPLRARLGASLAYQAWLAVPLMMAMALAPPLRGVPQPVRVALGAAPHTGLGPAIATQAAAGWGVWLLIVWVCGALAMAASFVIGHRRFVRRLGALTQQGTLHFSASGAEGPVLLGLWRPKLVLPADFHQRYSGDEQALIIAHENAHAMRRDPAANAFLALLQCCFWFNPLMYVAAPRFRLDQELACDAAVIATRPGAARAYACAMLKSQMDEHTPASCHWQSNHPLKERIMNLQRPPLALSRRIAGRFAIGALLLAGAGGTLLARADTAAPEAAKGPRYDVSMTLTAPGQTSKPRLLVADGERFRNANGSGDQEWGGEFTLNKVAGGKVFLRSKLVLDGKPIGEPSMLMALGEAAGVGVSSADGKANLKLEMVVKLLPETGTK